MLFEVGKFELLGLLLEEMKAVYGKAVLTLCERVDGEMSGSFAAAAAKKRREEELFSVTVVVPANIA